MPPEKLLSCPLLHCPFCGSEPELIDGPAGYFVLCNNTECDAGQVSKNWTKLAAITLWNTRTPSPELVELGKLSQEITDYFVAGGLFNPEMMEHDKVSCLLYRIRTAIDAAKEKK